MKNICQLVLKIIVLLIVVQFSILPTISHAGLFSDIINSGNSFLTEGKAQPNDGNGVNMIAMKNEAMKIYNLLFLIGLALSIIIGAILGIKLMFSGIDEKAHVKEALIAYVIGCAVIFGAFGIWKLVITLLGTIQ